MKLSVILLLLAPALQQTQPVSQDLSGLEVVKIELKEKYVASEEYEIIQNQTLRTRGVPLRPAEDLARRRIELRALSKIHSPDPVKVNYLQAQLKNIGANAILKFVLTYQMAVDEPGTPDQQFLCNVQVATGQTKTIDLIPRLIAHVVDTSGSGSKPVLAKPLVKEIIIDQIQFADGTTWQRPDWDKTSLLTPKGTQKLGKGKCMGL